MKFQLHDLYGDTITVCPVPSKGVLVKINIAFSDSDGDHVEMLLDDRMWSNLKQAGNKAMKESERMG